MRLLCIDSYGGDGALDLCLRWQMDGHEVIHSFRKTPRSMNFGRGLVQTTEDWRRYLRWADLVVLSDNTKHLRELDHWRAMNPRRIVGATTEAAQWELDRTIGQQVFAAAGIDTLPFEEFHSYDDAIAYVKKENRRFVSKPLGDEGDKSLSYVAKTPADLVYMLGRWKRQSKLKAGFILQEHISGCEMAVGGFFGPHGFNEGWCENWEEKALMAGGSGPNVGEMGTIVRFVKASKLAAKVLKPLEEQLHRVGYVGYVDVNCIIDEDGTPWPLEFTMRFGWPTFNIQQALLKGDSAEWLADLATGRDAKPFRLDEIAVGVVMALPEFPYGKTPMEKVVGVPIYGLSPDSMNPNVHLCEAMMGKAPIDQAGKIVDAPAVLTAGEYVLGTTGTGKSVREAREGAYRELDRLSAPASPFWRPDIGERLKKQLPQVQSHGYAAGMTF